MATAAFKSTSKRGTQSPTATIARNSQITSRNPSTRKRSQSVSAISRTKLTVDLTASEDYNRRENPLFLNSPSSSSHASRTSDKEIDGISNGRVNLKRVVDTASGISAAERGRSFTRNSGVRNGIGRSLSRVRGRSVSRGPCGASYESQKELEVSRLTNAETNGDTKRVAYDSKLFNKVRNGADVQRLRTSPQVTGSQCQATECSEDDSVCSFPLSNWEDGTSTCSLSEAEDRVTKAVYNRMRGNQSLGNVTATGIYETVQSEVRRALSDIHNNIGSDIRWSKVNGVGITNVDDLPSDLVNSQPVEVVLDIRREYAQKLEESEERARKLRADLAIEEHRGQEFSRLLKETLPDHHTSNSQKSRMGRKRSTERKRISKRLTEEAMAYFDECVSISTFEGSDFSAPEDPPPTSAGTSTPVYDALSTPQKNSSINASSLYVPDCSSNNRKTMDNHNQHLQSREDFGLKADGRFKRAFSKEEDDQETKNGMHNQSYQFSFAERPKEDVKSKHSMKSYLENFQRGNSLDSRTKYDASEYNLHSSVESLLFDRVFFRSRLESGSLHLCCGGGLAASFSPFGSIL